MDKVFHCHSFVSDIPDLGEKLVGTDRSSFHLRHLHHQKIPWSFWKKSKNPTVRSVMSWVDAIVFALVAVYFVNIYVFQNYQIPSSSLEKSLLVGDFLYVSKMSYSTCAEHTAINALGTTYIADSEY